MNKPTLGKTYQLEFVLQAKKKSRQHTIENAVAAAFTASGAAEQSWGALHCMARIVPKEPGDSALSLFAPGQMRTLINGMSHLALRKTSQPGPD